MAWWKTVIHAHTDYSCDANTSCAELIETACRQGVNCVTVTDHDEIAGALAAREIGRGRGVEVIVGEEISTADGHIIGLFLCERVPPGLSGEDTADEIHRQGGFVLAPHPYAVLCENSLRSPALDRLAPRLDAVEIANAQNPLLWENRLARRFAERRQITPYVGADTHIRGYLDAAYQLLPPFHGPAEFRLALRHARLYPGCFGPGYFVAMGVRHVWDMVMPTRLPGFGANVRDGGADARPLATMPRNENSP